MTSGTVVVQQQPHKYDVVYQFDELDGGRVTGTNCFSCVRLAVSHVERTWINFPLV